MENKKHNIIVYSTPTCPYCTMVKGYFAEKGIEFKDVNVAANHAAAAEMVEKSGQMGVPVIDVDGKIIVGFRPDVLGKLVS